MTASALTRLRLFSTSPDVRFASVRAEVEEERTT